MAGLVTTSAFAVNIPYFTGFETTEVPNWGFPNPAANADWNGLNNWRVSTAQKFAGDQALYATTNGITLLPSTTIQPDSFSNSQNQGQIQTNVKLFMETTSTLFGATSVANVHGLASNITWNNGVTSRALRFGVQNNGNIFLWNNSTFVYNTLGSLTNFRDQWLDLTLTIDTINPNVGLTLTIKDASNNQLFSTSTNLLSTGVADARVAFTTVVAASNGTGGAMGAYYDNFNIRAVPEPSSIALLGFGVTALIRKRKTQ
jgi:hypothetical protein